MKRHAKNADSSFLKLCYGDDYGNVLGGPECISFASDRNDSSRKRVLRVIAVLLLLVNVTMCLYRFPLWALAVFFTNWNMEVTMVLAISVLWSSFDPKVDQNKKWLAFVHILTEIAVLFNTITVLVYWSVLH